MPGITDVPGVEVFERGRGDFTLPSGYVDSDGAVHRQVVLRPMTGYEDDIMDDDDLVVTERISKVLIACCERLGEITDKGLISRAIDDTLESDEGLPITVNDRIAMLIYLRRASVGNLYKFERTCPYCEKLNKDMRLDLRELKIAHSKHPERRKVQITLPESKKVAVLKVLSAKDEREVVRLRPSMKDFKSLQIMARCVTLTDTAAPEPAAPTDLKAETDTKAEGQEDLPAAVKPYKFGKDPIADMKQIKGLPTPDRAVLRKVYNLMEGDVDTSVEIECKKGDCGRTFSFPLDLGQSFFFSPTAEVTSVEDLTWL